MPDRCRSALCFLIALAVTPAYAQLELPPCWIAVSVDAAELDAGPEAQPPPAGGAPLSTVAPGQTLTLRAKIVGGRRAYMMWPDTYANVGPNTTILVQGAAPAAEPVPAPTPTPVPATPPMSQAAAPRDVPGSRHPIGPNGTWQVWVAAPVPPANVRGPLYYVIKAKWATQTEESEEARVRVVRAE